MRTAPSQTPDQLGPDEWLLVQETGQGEGRRFWLVTLPAETPLTELVRHAKARFRIEQDYRELKQEVGLAHFEGRSWRGLNHHITLCLAAYGFLVRERSLFPLSPPSPPVRSARHSPWSVATLRRRVAYGLLLSSLPRCPCCGIARPLTPQSMINSPQIE